MGRGNESQHNSQGHMMAAMAVYGKKNNKNLLKSHDKSQMILKLGIEL